MSRLKRSQASSDPEDLDDDSIVDDGTEGSSPLHSVRLPPPKKIRLYNFMHSINHPLRENVFADLIPWFRQKTLEQAMMVKWLGLEQSQG